MLFTDFSHYLEQLESTPSRLDMTRQLAELYRQLDQSEVAEATYLMQGQLVPEYESLEFNLSTKMVQRALVRLLSKHVPDANAAAQTNLFGEEISDRFADEVLLQFKKVGDIGSVAEAIILQVNQTAGQLSVREVYEQLKTIAEYEGKGSQDQKVMGLVALLEQVQPLAGRYIIRIIIGKVRLGFSTMTMLDALSWAVVGDKSDRVILENAYNKQADVGRLASVYLFAPDEHARQKALELYSVHNGVPVVPALAQRLDSAQEMIEKMTEVIVEPKYDGLRIQIHFQRGKAVKAYTRNMEDMSHMAPELQQLSDLTTADSFILDGEAIGYDPATGALVAFQQTITRKRKHDVAEQAQQVPFRFFVFDMLEINGESLVDQPLHVRKEKLQALFTSDQTFQQTEWIQTTDPAKITEYHHQQLADGLEGIIAKQVDSQYFGGRKGWRWVKMKEEEGTRGKLSDTIDVVVMGYYVGKGKRSAFGIGAILVGVRDDDADTIKTITKIGTGLTDEQFREMKQRVDQVVSTNKPTLYDVPNALIPDVWADPHVVIEVAADEITDSPLHTAGVALRFPRLITFRDDKNWESATTIAELKQIQH